MGELIDTTLLLVDLDEKQIEVWSNRRGWFHCSKRHLKAYDGKKPIPVHGPFRTAVEAGKHALERLNDLESAA